MLYETRWTPGWLEERVSQFQMSVERQDSGRLPQYEMDDIYIDVSLNTAIGLGNYINLSLGTCRRTQIAHTVFCLKNTPTKLAFIIISSRN